MPRSDITYRDVPALAPTILMPRGEEPASVATTTPTRRTAADSTHDQRTPAAATAGT